MDRLEGNTTGDRPAKRQQARRCNLISAATKVFREAKCDWAWRMAPKSTTVPLLISDFYSDAIAGIGKCNGKHDPAFEAVRKRQLAMRWRSADRDQDGYRYLGLADSRTDPSRACNRRGGSGGVRHVEMPTPTFLGSSSSRRPECSECGGPLPPNNYMECNFCGAEIHSIPNCLAEHEERCW